MQDLYARWCRAREERNSRNSQEFTHIPTRCRISLLEHISESCFNTVVQDLTTWRCGGPNLGNRRLQELGYLISTQANASREVSEVAFVWGYSDEMARWVASMG
jgi:hypothetical protein